MARTTARRPLSDLVLEEIRVAMARQRLSQTDLATRLSEGQPWVSRRLSGRTPLTVDDVERVAGALRVDVAELIPGARREGSDLRRAA